MKWKVRRSRYVHQDNWISLRADDCVNPDGVEIAPYYVLEYPDFVHVLALDEDSNVVLVRQYRHGGAVISLELPGGCLERSDPNVIVAGARELLEETGYAGDPPKLLASLSVDPAKFSNRLHLVLIENARAVSAASLDQTEDIETILVPLQEALQHMFEGGIINAAQVGLMIIGLRKAGKLTVTIP
jgi:8-oxo-dGTP pyrophosphatase MutT (NUDIX family)